MSENIENILFATSSKNENNKELLLEQYKILIESLNLNSERRHSTNSFFLTVHTILLTALSGLLGLTQEFSVPIWWVIIPSFAGVVFCFSWRKLVLSYKQLNSGKFKIVFLIEAQLKVRLFEAEWEALNHGDGTVYTPFTKTEANVPVIFASIYCFLILLGLLDFIF